MKMNKMTTAVILALLLAAPITVMIADAAPSRSASCSANTYNSENSTDTDYFEIVFYRHISGNDDNTIAITDENEDDFTEVIFPLKNPARIIYTYTTSGVWTTTYNYTGAANVVYDHTYMVVKKHGDHSSFNLELAASITGTPANTYNYSFKIGGTSVPVGGTISGIQDNVAYKFEGNVAFTLSSTTTPTQLFNLTPTLGVAITLEDDNTAKTGSPMTVKFRTPLEAFRDDLVELNEDVFEDTQLRLTTNITDRIGLYVEADTQGASNHYITPGRNTANFDFTLTIPAGQNFYINSRAYYADFGVEITIKEGDTIVFHDTESYTDRHTGNINNSTWNFIALDNSGTGLTTYGTNETQAKNHMLTPTEDQTVTIRVFGQEIAHNGLGLNPNKGVATFEIMPVFS